MGSEATIKNNSGNYEGDGLMVLDIVKHAAKTIICSLEKQDRLAIVSFSSNGKVECNFLEMTKGGQKRATAALEALDPNGSTNLWDGLLKGFDLFL